MTRDELLAYHKRFAYAASREVTQPVDLVLDGSPDDIAIIIDGIRLRPLDVSDAGFVELQSVFHQLVALRDELVSWRGWAQDVRRHLADLPAEPWKVP